MKGRLPDKSRYELTYDAVKQEWNGNLNVRDGVGSYDFIATASAIVKCIGKLDDMYRDSLRGGKRNGKQENVPAREAGDTAGDGS